MQGQRFVRHSIFSCARYSCCSTRRIRCCLTLDLACTRRARSAEHTQHAHAYVHTCKHIYTYSCARIHTHALTLLQRHVHRFREMRTIWGEAAEAAATGTLAGLGACPKVTGDRQRESRHQWQLHRARPLVNPPCKDLQVCAGYFARPYCVCVCMCMCVGVGVGVSASECTHAYGVLHGPTMCGVFVDVQIIPASAPPPFPHPPLLIQTITYKMYTLYTPAHTCMYIHST